METGIGKEAREEGIPGSDENQKLLVAFVNLYDVENADCNRCVVSFRYLIKKPLCNNHEATTGTGIYPSFNVTHMRTNKPAYRYLL